VHLEKHVLPAFASKRFPDVTLTALEAFRALLIKPEAEGGKALALKSARDIIDGTFRALYRDARKEGLATGDPFAGLTWPRKVVPEPDPFTAEERETLCAHFAERDRFWFPVVLTRFWTGLRPSELRGLRRSDWNARTGTIRIRVSRTLGEDNAPKTVKSARTITVVPAVRRALLDRPAPLDARADDFLFTTPTGKSLDEDRFVEQHWHRALRATGTRPRKFHATRHTFISCGLTQGANLKWLADYCGTSVAMIEKHYGRWMHSDDAQLAILTAAEPRGATGKTPRRGRKVDAA
jgi:integrase